MPEMQMPQLRKVQTAEWNENGIWSGVFYVIEYSQLSLGFVLYLW